MCIRDRYRTVIGFHAVVGGFATGRIGRDRFAVSKERCFSVFPVRLFNAAQRARQGMVKQVARRAAFIHGVARTAPGQQVLFRTGEGLSLIHIFSREALEDSRNILRYYRHGILWRVGISLLAGGCISFFLSAQPLFTALLFLMFLVAECIFDMIFYRRFLKE